MKHKLVSSLLYRTSIVFTALVMAIFPNTAAFAFDELFYSSNEILYYEPGTGCVEPGVSYSTRMDLPSLVGNDNAEKIWNFFIDKGLTAEQTAGIMGNIRKESNFEPDITEGDPSWAGAGFGIMQWTGQDKDGDGINDLDPRGPIRRTQLENAAKEAGVQPSDLSFQLAYAYQEIQGMQVGSFGVNNGRAVPGTTPEDDLWEAIKNQTDYTQVAILFHDGYLRSADSDEEIKSKRGGEYAKQALDSFRSLTGGSSGSTPVSKPSGGSAGCAPFAGGDLIQTLLAYAHPTYSEPRYPLNPEPKPAYLEAAKKAESEGKWVGGGTQEIGVPGIDCGGFVSLLLTQSGFEPDYNYGLDLGRGASNQEYGQQPWAEKYWTYLGRGKEINVSDLRPGDVAYSSGHTFIFVGQVDGFESQYASASYSYSGRSAGGWDDGVSWRAPMAAGSWDGGYESATNPDYVWYGRREGTPLPYGSTNRADPGQGVRES